MRPIFHVPYIDRMATLGASGEDILPITCNGKRADLYTAKLKPTGKQTGKCVLYESSWHTLSEFEALAGMQSAKKWRSSIRYNGKPIADWFSSKEPDPTSLSQSTITKVPETRVRTSEQNPTQSLPARNPMPSLDADFSAIFQEIETNVKHSLNGLVQEAMQTLKSSFMEQFTSLKQEIETLKERISILETPSTSNESTQSPSAGTVRSVMEDESIRSLQAKVDSIADSLTLQQKSLEAKERVLRAKNVVITGFSEEEEEDLTERVKSLFEETLQTPTSAAEISSVKRLGKPSGKSPRPTLVSFNSISAKSEVMKNKSKLKGSRLFVNNDLTPKQREEDRRTRSLKRLLVEHPDYAGKRITIYRGKLHADKSPIEETVLQTLLPPQ